MTERNPSGTRDFLPDEMRELRTLTSRVLEVFERAGYGEVYTPSLEFEREFEQAHAARPAYRTFGEQGEVLVLRSDMTVPIARVAASRYAHAPKPLRFCYMAHVFRGVKPQRGLSREFLQAGIELIGAPGARGTAEVLEVLTDTLEAAGLRTFAIGVGSAALLPGLLATLGVDGSDAEAILAALGRGDFVEAQHRIGGLGLTPEATELLMSIPERRGGPEILGDLPEPLADAVQGLRELHGLLAPRVAERIIYDLGLVRSIGYYTGAVFQVYDPSVGVPLGGGGRYDDLLGSFGVPSPAAGFALNVERLHIALAAEEQTIVGSGVPA